MPTLALSKQREPPCLSHSSSTPVNRLLEDFFHWMYNELGHYVHMCGSWIGGKLLQKTTSLLATRVKTS
jgi:hypothetical protein